MKLNVEMKISILLYRIQFHSPFVRRKDFLKISVSKNTVLHVQRNKTPKLYRIHKNSWFALFSFTRRKYFLVFCSTCIIIHVRIIYFVIKKAYHFSQPILIILRNNVAPILHLFVSCPKKKKLNDLFTVEIFSMKRQYFQTC